MILAIGTKKRLSRNRREISLAKRYFGLAFVYASSGIVSALPASVYNKRNAMLTLSKQTPKRGSTCQTCMVVRTFVIMAILVAAFTIVADDRMQILASVTPMHAALAIISIGLAGFVVKLLVLRREQANNLSSGHEQGAQQEAYQAETDQTSSR